MTDLKSSVLTETNLNGYQATNNAFAGTRFYGGSMGTDSPFVKGYFQVFFELPPVAFASSFDVTDNNSVILTASCSSFTPPGDRTINTVEIAGQGGIKANYATGQTLANDFSLTFQEKSSLPIWKVFRKWSSSIIDPYLGVSGMSNFDPSNYKGSVMVVQTTPVATNTAVNSNLANLDDVKKNIQKVFYFDGVFPTTDLSSIFDSNITSNDIIQDINIPFKFDGTPLTEEDSDTLDTAANNLVNGNLGLYTSIKNYYNELFVI